MISSVTITFSSFEGTVETSNDDFLDATVNISLDIYSISTGVEQIDGHLKSANFFDATNFPKLTFAYNSF